MRFQPILWIFPVYLLSIPAARCADVDFNRDIRPILSDKCFHCHGPDAQNQKSKFRMDSQAGLLAELNGGFAVVPGDLKKSELHWRIRASEGDEDLMPPARSKRSLTETEKDLLDRWILQGAPYDEHWSFQPVERPSLPELASPWREWAANEIDVFVGRVMQKHGLSPSPRAEKERLLRRVTLDLTGLPPTPEEVDQYLQDPSDDAWERVVDRLLETQAYGERMALVWLDAARYADSGGYQNDIKRTQWPWRDWVIRAYQRNLPFDQFTIEQLAGDLLTNPSEEQRLATAFNRNHRINNEGGIIAEEFLVEYVADRVETTSTVWMGLTVGCARCHDHKYDPITQRDFFELYAFFHNVPENGRDGNLAPAPNLGVYTEGTREQHEAMQSSVEQLRARIRTLPKERETAFAAWRGDRLAEGKTAPLSRVHEEPVMHLPFELVEGRRARDAREAKRRPVLVGRGQDPKVAKLTEGDQGLTFGASGLVKVTGAHGKAFDSARPWTWVVKLKAPGKFNGSEGPVLCAVEEGTQRGYRLMLEEPGEGNLYHCSFQLYENGKKREGIEVLTEPIVPRNKPVELAVTWNGQGTGDGVRIYLNGEPIAAKVVRDQLKQPVVTNAALLVGARSEKDARATLRDATFRSGVIGDVRLYDIELDAAEVKDLAGSELVDDLARLESGPGRDYLREVWLRKIDPVGMKVKANLEKEEGQLKQFEARAITRVSIMEEMAEPRKTYLLERGAYDHPDTSEELQPATLSALPRMKEELPRNRLGLARWLVEPDHPLTARVAVNRYWQMYFGMGLVKTPEDFGSQGAPPSHPRLLDWLASEFVNGGWDIKAMQKKIVMSATYQQSSRVTPEMRERDPENRWLARGPRFRLYGQALRDQALAVGGLLSPKVGGPPVMPYQPEGLWEEVSAKGYKYVVGKGEDLYRRSLYTFWRRTVPPPSMMNFDNSAREICSVGSNRTNTPLQAMNLMNDPQFVEAARALGERMIREGGTSIRDRLVHGHRLVLARHPDPATLRILTKGYEEYQAVFQAEPERARQFLSTGQAAPAAELDGAELAAAAAVGSILLNLDETLTKE